MLKKDLTKKNEELQTQLNKEQGRPVGHTIQNCTISMDSNEENIAIANAVKEGMKALQAISQQNKYGIYLDGKD